MPLVENHTTKIYYEAYGQPDHPCLILIMGIGAQLIHWPREMIEHFVKQGFYVIAFDNRDIGLSRYYDELKSPSLWSVLAAKYFNTSCAIPYTLSDMAADVIELMNMLNIAKAHIAGISMGGMIAQLVAINYPTRVNSLICIATTSGASHLPSPKFAVLKAFFNNTKIKDEESYVKQMIEIMRIYHHPDDFNAAAAEAIAIQAYRRAFHPEGPVRQFLAILLAPARTEQLRKLLIPSLIIHGDHDPVFSLHHAEQLVECIPHSHLVVFKKMGHAFPERLYAAFAETIRQHVDRQRDAE